MTESDDGTLDRTEWSDSPCGIEIVPGKRNLPFVSANMEYKIKTGRSVTFAFKEVFTYLNIIICKDNGIESIHMDTICSTSCQ